MQKSPGARFVPLLPELGLFENRFSMNLFALTPLYELARPNPIFLRKAAKADKAYVFQRKARCCRL